MKQVGLAMHNFHDVYRRLPPAVRTDEAGRPLCSWRFQLAPFMEAWMLDFDFDTRWDDPANRYFWVYSVCCWNRDKDDPQNPHTNVVAITGAGTAFEAGKVIRLSDLDQDTILAIEVANSDTYWMEPGDITVDDIDDSTLQGPDGTGFFVIFMTGEVWFLAAETPLAELRKFLTIEASKQYDRDEVLGAFQKK